MMYMVDPIDSDDTKIKVPIVIESGPNSFTYSTKIVEAEIQYCTCPYCDGIGKIKQKVAK
jgi:hypothetical protein